MLRRFPLSFKFAALFSIVVILMGAFISLTVRYSNVVGVSEIVRNQSGEEVKRIVNKYYDDNGSLDGFGRYFREYSIDDWDEDDRGRDDSDRQGGPEPPPRGDGPRLSPADAPRSAAFGVLTPDFRVMVPVGEFPPQSTTSLEEVTASGTFTVEEIRNRGELIAYLVINQEVAAQSMLTTGEADAIRELNLVVLLSALGAAAFASLFGFLFSRYLTRPIEELVTATDAIARGELKQEIQSSSLDEIGDLARAFNKMSVDLQHATEMRKQMTADIAHDLGTPLQVIAGYVESMREGVLKPTPERFDTIYSEIEHLQHLVADLRTLSKAEAGELKLNRQTLPAEQLLQRVAKTYANRAGQRNVSIELELQASKAPIYVDEERMIQVFGNLVSNALRYTPEMGKIILSVVETAEAYIFKVHDTGQGISAEDLPHIFDRFYRADKAREGEQGESGLGLAIAKAIVEAHQGTISAASDGSGTGATFTVQLPLSAA